MLPICRIIFFLCLLLPQRVAVLGISLARDNHGAITTKDIKQANENHMLCLNMIVKDEAHVLPRLLASVQDYIDYYVVVDTGSTDDTIHILESAITKTNSNSTSTATINNTIIGNTTTTTTTTTINSTIISSMGEIHQRPWVNFGYNRNEALQLAVAAACHWVLIMDADDLLVVESGDFKKPTTTNNGGNRHGVGGLVNGRTYLLEKRYGTFVNPVPCLIDVQAYKWAWKGPLHEYLECRHHENDIDCDGSNHETRQDMWINETRGESGRLLGMTLEEKYMRDARILSDCLEQHPDAAREQFYLARSYMDARQHELALLAYRKRVTMGGWYEEVVYSQLEIGRIMIHLTRSPEDVMKEYLAAYAFKPLRGEPLYELADYFRQIDDKAKTILFAKAGVDIPQPQTGEHLFSNYASYDYGFLSLFCSSAYYIWRFEKGKQACQEIMRRFDEQNEFIIPQSQRDLSEDNIKYYLDVLGLATA